MHTVFSLSGLLVMPVWIAIIALPGWKWTERVMRSPWSVAPAAVLYAMLVLPVAAELLPVLAAPELGPIRAVLGTEQGATIAWVHFLAFDLFVGRWAYLDARVRGIPGWITAPVLALTLMFGPLGFLVYLVVREQVGARRRMSAMLKRVQPALQVNRPLAVVAIAMVALLLAMLVGVAVDPREITGAPAWLKPAKFAASISIYSFTLLWLLGRVEGRKRLVWITGTLSAVALAAEWVIIAAQAVRGTSSHFNISSPLDGTLWALMGVFIVVIWVMNLLAALLLVRQRSAEPWFDRSLRLGLVCALVGGAMGAAMTRPTGEQAEMLAAGANVTSIGGHSVGAADGGAGLPGVGWSTEGGDVRVAHFFGLHGLQAIPLLGWLVGRTRRPRAGHKRALVTTGGIGYIGLTLILFWQALRGESVVAPSSETIAALALLGLAVTLVVAVVVIHAHFGWVRTQGWLARAA